MGGTEFPDLQLIASEPWLDMALVQRKQDGALFGVHALVRSLDRKHLFVIGHSPHVDKITERLEQPGVPTIVHRYSSRCYFRNLIRPEVARWSQVCTVMMYLVGA